MKKATQLHEIDYAVKYDEPVDALHPFYTDFTGLRGRFSNDVVYKALNVNPKTFLYEQPIGNKTLLFLGGMRGSGKTSELAKYAQELHKPDCFFVVTCNIDNELDMNDIEYMDILIFQIEKLLKAIENAKLEIKSDILDSLKDWFTERVKEINNQFKKEGGLEMEIGVEPNPLKWLLYISGKIRGSLSVSRENAEKVRLVFKNRFGDFALKFNLFIESINYELRHYRVAKEILFIVDGLEKTMTADIRRKIVIDESNRFRQIKVNTIFTLPIELMKEQQKLKQFCSDIRTFPFIKLIDKEDKEIEKAFEKFLEFVYKRIEAHLFDSEETVRHIIRFSGGSPRELLRIIQRANAFADEEKGKIDIQAVEEAILSLAAETSLYLTEEDLALLKVLRINLIHGMQTPFNEGMQHLLENLIVFEYNDGTYKRVNPIVEKSEIYQQYVLR